jgi:hypothetical protein
MNQANLKTLVPAVVSAGVLAYEALSGHQVLPAIQNTITNDILTVAGLGFTLWGIWKNHKKGA